MKRYSLLLLLAASMLNSCLKETGLPISADFTVVMQKDNNTSPVTVSIENCSKGTDFYEWVFEGGVPEKSSKKEPGQIRFTEPGEHRITLRAWNNVDERSKEVIVRVDSAITIGFDLEILVNDIAPAGVKVINKTKGGTTYDWKFEGGTPSSSSAIAPGTVVFDEGGEHEISLKVFNGSEYFETSKKFVLQSPMQADFSYVPSPVDEDMEAPLTLHVENRTINGLSYKWSCAGATIANPTAKDKTSIRFEQGGTYQIELVADNQKEKKTVKKTVIIKENSGLLQVSDLRFGINEAKNSIGCFFSSTLRRVLTSKELVTAEIGSTVDIGFFALNSNFGYCYFFSPDKAGDAAFFEIPGAIKAVVLNLPENYGVRITENVFSGIQCASDLNQFTIWNGNAADFFTQSRQPHFVLFRTEDGRRGIIHIKQYVGEGIDSYIIADLKIDKRKDQ